MIPKPFSEEIKGGESQEYFPKARKRIVNQHLGYELSLIPETLISQFSKRIDAKSFLFQGQCYGAPKETFKRLAKTIKSLKKVRQMKIVPKQ